MKASTIPIVRRRFIGSFKINPAKMKMNIVLVSFSAEAIDACVYLIPAIHTIIAK